MSDTESSDVTSSSMPALISSTPDEDSSSSADSADVIATCRLCAYVRAAETVFDHSPTFSWLRDAVLIIHELLLVVYPRRFWLDQDWPAGMIYATYRGLN